MEMTCDAKRIVAVSLGKLYSSRSQRGGCRLHRSLLLSLVVRSAREIYHACSAQAAAALCAGRGSRRKSALDNFRTRRRVASERDCWNTVFEGSESGDERAGRAVRHQSWDSRRSGIPSRSRDSGSRTRLEAVPSD
nr:PREDICTED: immediate early response gene 2 protein [Lepisosteus oculatus]